MSARIAPEPISSGFAAVPDFRSRAATGDSRPLPEQPRNGSDDKEKPTASSHLAPLPAPPPPTGAAFAVALISGQLPPRPTSERELLMRLGSAQLPAQGSLALHDRRV